MKKFLVISMFVASLLLGVIIYANVFDKEPEPVDVVGDDTTIEDPPTIPDENMVEDDPKPIADGVLDCSDCIFAPVDKTHLLPSTYAPTVRTINASGGGSLIPEAATKVEELFEKASEDGISMYVRSAYRSYATQEVTFEKWVGVEMAKGLSRAEAEAEANTYSARPGASEHQLGTTLDLLCSGCGFEESEANEVVWEWLGDNASDFGFALSYPEGRTDDTGYVYEPWHWRYLGQEKADEYNSQSRYTLNQWLARQ